MCSPVELQLLWGRYGVPPSKLVLAPFFVPPPPAAEALPAFGARRHFVSIGNFKHPPNLDSVCLAATISCMVIKAAFA